MPEEIKYNHLTIEDLEELLDKKKEGSRNLSERELDEIAGVLTTRVRQELAKDTQRRDARDEEMKRQADQQDEARRQSQREREEMLKDRVRAAQRQTAQTEPNPNQNNGKRSWSQNRTGEDASEDRETPRYDRFTGEELDKPQRPDMDLDRGLSQGYSHGR